MSNRKDEARDQAFLLYNGGKNQKEIAAILGVAEKTVGIWRREDKWKKPPRVAETLGEIPPWAMALLNQQALLQKQLQILLTRTAPPS